MHGPYAHAGFARCRALTIRGRSYDSQELAGIREHRAKRGAKRSAFLALRLLLDQAKSNSLVSVNPQFRSGPHHEILNSTTS